MDRNDPKKYHQGTTTACYFCNQFIDERYLADHIVQCGAVLEPCPYKCGVYVPRSTKDKHMQECAKRKTRPRSNYDSLPMVRISPPVNTDFIGTEIASLRSSLGEERQYRQRIQLELQMLRKQCQKIEQNSHSLAMTIDAMQKTFLENLDNHSVSNTKSKLEVDNLKLQQQVHEDHRKQMDMNLDYIRSRILDSNNKLSNLDMMVKNQEEKLVLLDRLQLEVSSLKQTLVEEQNLRQDAALSWRQELDEFKDFFSQENAMISAVWNDQVEEMKKVKNDLETVTEDAKDLSVKHHALNYEFQTVKQASSEVQERMQSQENDIKKLLNSVGQLKEDMTALEISVFNQNLVKSHLSTPGHIIWRISDFGDKMKSAKENDTVLKSPIFLSKDYGYRLRLEVYLNGMKKWKGRHLLASLQVMKGDWDPLLTWPCQIEARVVLRDQTTNKNEARDFVKHISAKRRFGNEENEDPQESSAQYIFITHATLDKQNYVKDDTLFFDITVLNENKEKILSTEL